jgi:lysyl-tRNA synthetase, class II
MLEKVQQDRLEKLAKLRELGVEPFGHRVDGIEPIDSVLNRYEEVPEGSEPTQSARIAGRIVLWRDMGKMIFATLRDSGGQMQIALRKNALDETAWSVAKLLDLGDLITVQGPLQRTRTHEITAWASELTLLCKALLPMPEKFHGLTDTEIRYRQRYLDLMTNPESMAVFRRRITIIDSIRQTLKDRGYVEVETPMMQPIYGGAAARPFTTHHNTLDCDLFLRISPELYLKRLLVGGMERVFEINRNFRNEGLSTRHNPEFTMMELYEAYADYHTMMDIAEEIFAKAIRDACDGQTKRPFGEAEIDYATPWRRAKYADLLKEHAGVGMADIPAVREKARQLEIDEAGMDDAVVVNEVFEATVEKHLIQPTFVMDYPAALCPLTRRHPENPDIALRFELFIAGMEIANAYTELNDPAVQLENFQQQVRGEEGETMRVMDDDFVTALQQGMPPAGGMGIGIDRMVMLLTDRQSIRDVVLFPLLRQATE